MVTVYKQIAPNSPNITWPKERSGHRMCADGNFLYIFGGYNPEDDNKTYNELWRFNISTQNWTTLPDPDNVAPKSCASSSMLLWQSKIFIFGGTGYPFASSNSNELFMYNLRSHKWFDLNELARLSKLRQQSSNSNNFKVAACGCQKIMDSPPMPKYGQSMVMSPKQKLFIFSGTTGQQFSSELHSFCLQKLVWVEYKLCDKHSRHAPVPRYRHEGVVVGKDYYIMGGATLDEYFNFNDLQSFNFSDKSWRIIPSKSTEKKNNAMSFPLPRKAYSCVLKDKFIYMVAGVNYLQGSLNDCWKFNTCTSVWERLKYEFPYPVLFHSAAISGGVCMYIFGGVKKDGKRVSDLHYAWLSVPTLKHQSWMKVASLLRQNNSLNKDTLQKLGLPKHFFFLIDDNITSRTNSKS